MFCESLTRTVCLDAYSYLLHSYPIYFVNVIQVILARINS